VIGAAQGGPGTLQTKMFENNPMHSKQGVAGMDDFERSASTV
jgi:hypothetical protein